MIRSLYYSPKQKMIEREGLDKEHCEALRDKKHILWIDLFDPTEEEIKSVLEEPFGFHELSIEDVNNENHHTKLDEYPTYLFVVIFGGYIDHDDLPFPERKLSAYLGDNFLVTVHRYPSPGIESAFHQYKANPALFTNGPDHIFHTILDAAVDQYIPLLDGIDEEMDSIEEQVFVSADNSLLSRIFSLKRRLMRLHRTATYQREVLNRLSRGEFKLVTEHERIYYRNVYDHLVRVTDLTEIYRDLITSTMDIYLSVVNNRMNGVMKMLTIISTIMLPLSLIAGIYGMNFKFMPELYQPWAYPIVLLVMLCLALSMLWFFKKRGWIFSK